MTGLCGGYAGPKSCFLAFVFVIFSLIMKDGKKLESLVKLIQETLKDSPSTIIYGNKKVRNTGGNKREFDIFIEGNISNFPIKIAIECKDYAKAVSVEKIEAFQAKCSRIPDINKKVFVATNGYQRDAIQAAKEFGIELYHVADIDATAVRKWLPITQLGLRFEVKEFNFALDTDEQSLETVNQPGRKCWFVYHGSRSNVLALINQKIIDNKDRVWEEAIFNLMRNSQKEELGGKLTLPFKIAFNLADALIKSEDLELPLKEINGIFEVLLVESKTAALTIKDYSTQDESKAKYVEFDNGEHGTVEVVVTPNNYKFFHTNPKGQTTPLVSLGTYDPKTDQFTSTRHDEDRPTKC